MLTCCVLPCFLFYRDLAVSDDSVEILVDMIKETRVALTAAGPDVAMRTGCFFFHMTSENKCSVGFQCFGTFDFFGFLTY